MRRLYKIFLLVIFVTGSSLGQQLYEQLEDAKQKVGKDACDLQALSNITTLLRKSLGTGRSINPQNPSKTLEDLATYSTQGLSCLKGVSAKSRSADQVKTNKELIVTFSGGAGFAALQNKQYVRAQHYLQSAVDADPNDIKNVWSLALAYLNRGYGSASPREVGAGLFYVARAASLSPRGKARHDIEQYMVKAYTAYHGSRAGCDELMRKAEKYGAPPPGFRIMKRQDSSALQ